MSRTRTYRCLNCLDETVTRSFDASHLSRTCPNCGSFERFVNEAVIERFESLEESPPAAFDWDRLDRREKLLVAERLARTDATLADVSVTEPGAGESVGLDGGTADGEEGESAEARDGESPEAEP